MPDSAPTLLPNHLQMSMLPRAPLVDAVQGAAAGRTASVAGVAGARWKTCIGAGGAVLGADRRAAAAPAAHTYRHFGPMVDNLVATV
jgi:hypothetical protein